MPLPPKPIVPATPLSPRRVLLESPLAAASLMRARRRWRDPPRTRVRHWAALIGTFLVHLLFLAIFVLGPPYDWQPPRAPPEAFLQVRLIDADELPPPPPASATPPRQIGPRHQGSASAAAMRAAARERSLAARRDAAASTPPAPAVVTPQPAAAPPPSAAVPAPAPTPQLQPVPLAGEPPTVAVAAPSVQTPVPPRYQPEAVRPPREEGTQPILPPPSLALPDIPSQMPPPTVTPSIALRAEVPRSAAPASVSPARAQLPAAPPVPDLQSVPRPAQAAPTVNLQPQLHVPTPTAERELPQVQAPATTAQAAPMQAIPLAPAESVRVATPAAKPDAPVAASADRPVVQAVAAPSIATAASAPSEAPASANPSAAEAAAPASAAAGSASQADVSTAPNATPQGRDDAIVGVDAAASAAPTPGAGAPASANAGARPAGTAGSSAQGKGREAGQPGGNQPGAAQGAREGVVGDYTQLKPRGDTQVMRHGAPNIGYKPTRFEQDWTPEGESSIDTALRRAVEKTTVSKTFHLPRGVRVKCAAQPLLPLALFHCGFPDPPPKPVASKVYDRLHMAPANPVATPTPAASTAPAPAPTIKLDNTVECAAARVAGGPPPPGCALPATTNPKPVTPAPASSSWVPASDQFH